MDIASAYLKVPVNLNDRSLLVMSWAGQLYFDTRLRFGLRAEPKGFYSDFRRPLMGSAKSGSYVGGTLPRQL